MTEHQRQIRILFTAPFVTLNFAIFLRGEVLSCFAGGSSGVLEEERERIKVTEVNKPLIKKPLD